MNCTAYVSFAASQPSGASPPSGAVTYEELYTSSPVNQTSLLPDLATQVQKFLTSKQRSQLGRSVFAISSGFWDIYQLAGLDYALAQNLTDAAVESLVAQVHILYTHYSTDISFQPLNENKAARLPPFQLIIPRLFDPSLVPGWMLERAVPISPSTIAEQQKQAVYLTERWNSGLENALGTWVAAGAEDSLTVTPRRDIFYYDLPRHLLDIMIEHQLEHAGQRDASGWGTGKSPFTSVTDPCLDESAHDQKNGGDKMSDAVCADPSTYLFWDGFNLGCTANIEIGRQVATMIREGGRMNK